MNTESLVAKAEAFARKMHAGQYRRDGVTPYIEHPRAVANMLAEESEEIVATAWLHDVMEDCGVTHRDLLREAGMPMSVITAVSTLTKGCESYPDYLEFVKANEICRRVKIADMLHNLSDSPTDRQIEKYTKGILFLSK